MHDELVDYVAHDVCDFKKKIVRIMRCDVLPLQAKPCG